MNDINRVTLQGRLATKPEIRQFDNGTRMVRLLITTRQGEPRRRVDVVPISVWDLEDARIEAIRDTPVGATIRIAGTIQRRFWSSGEDGRSGLEVVADEVYDPEHECPCCGATGLSGSSQAYCDLCNIDAGPCCLYPRGTYRKDKP